LKPVCPGRPLLASHQGRSWYPPSARRPVVGVCKRWRPSRRFHPGIWKPDRLGFQMRNRVFSFWHWSIFCHVWLWMQLLWWTS
jgi:hypothetical protein